MIESIWIAILFVAVIFQVIAIYDKSIIFSVFTIMFWLVLMMECLVIELPYYSQMYNITTTNITTSEGVMYFGYPGLSALFLGFVFINIIYVIIEFMDFQDRNNLP